MPPVRSLLLLCCALPIMAAESTVVHKTADPLEALTWGPGPWSTATVATAIVADAAGAGGSTKALEVSATFSGNGFEHGSAEPLKALTIPGALQSVSLWYKGNGKDYPLIVNFVDAWGRGEVNGAKLEWTPGSAKTGEWTKATFTVPAGWMKPVRIGGFSTHNWGDQKTAATVKLLIDQIEVDTDLAGVDPATGLTSAYQPNPDPKKKDEPAPRAPLLESGLTSGQETEVFTGKDPAFLFSARNWRAGAAKGSIAWTLHELPDGSTAKKVTSGLQPVEIDSVANLALPMPVPRYGLYRLDARLTWADGKSSDSSITFASLAPQPELDDKAKDASPWGMNMHGGHAIFPASLRRAGVIWYRDYAFNYGWMVRAKGADKRYADWPWYPKIMHTYMSAGVRVLPILASSITFKEGVTGPDRAWRTEISDILNAFPQMRMWELDNEYDGMWTEPARKEAASGWVNWNAFHKAFASVVDAVGGGELTAVENGRAGIHPELVADCVRSGAYDGIKVINGHHYCGIDAPELNIANQNTGGEQGDPQLFHDRLRSLKAAGQLDGKARPMWLTEFGWDTRAGKVVTPWQQAVYLQRGFLLALHAGTEKAFWFWAQDESENPTTFFGGCGLLDMHRQPKLAFAAMAGMAGIMPNPNVTGTLDAGPGTFGYLIRQGDKRIVALWSLEKNDGPEVELANGTLQDFLGNPLTGRKVRLSMAPVYAVDVPESDRFAKQGSWDLASPWLIHATAGDPLTIRVSLNGDRSAAITGSVALQGPEGWTVGAAKDASAAPKASQETALDCTVPATAKPGEYVLHAVVSEGQVLKRMPVRIIVREPLSVAASRLTGDPGATDVTVTLTNHSKRDLSGTIALKLPGGWSAAKLDIPFAPLKGGERRDIKVPLTWTASWKPDEQATLVATASDGSSARTGLVPGALTLPRLAAFKPDGELKEWPATSRIPAWVLASSSADPQAAIHVAWTDAGLAIGLDVHDSTLVVGDPKAFWDADAIEILLDTRDRKGPRHATKGERQFWLVPQPAKGGIFAGAWKRGDEIPETRNGIPEILGASRKTADGYVLEAVIPATLVPGLTLKPGGTISGILLLAVRGKTFHRDIGWPATKSGGTGGGPESWPVMVLGE